MRDSHYNVSGRKKRKQEDWEETEEENKVLFYEKIGENFRCRICGVSKACKNNRLRDIKEHFEICHLGVKYECEVCFKNFSRHRDLQFHLKTHELEGYNIRKRKATCESRRKKKIVEQEETEDVAEDEKPPTKLKRTRKKEEDKAYIRVGDSFQCKLCDKTNTGSNAKRAITEHYNSDHLGLTYQCELCTKVFRRQRDLHTHLKKTHSGVKEEYSCHFCNYSARNKFSLKRHFILQHTNDEAKAAFLKHQCSSCSYRTFTASQLLLHVNLVHKKVKAFVCPAPQCGRRFSRKVYMKIHVKDVHEGVKELICDRCSFATNNKILLKKHIASVHARRDAFPCSACEFKTRSEDYLARHVASVHLGRKPYVCEVCAFATSYQSHLRRHIVTTHSAHPHFYECQLCSYKTQRKDNLKKHVSGVHKMTPLTAGAAPAGGVGQVAVAPPPPPAVRWPEQLL